MSTIPLDALPMETLRRRSSSKWRTYPADVLPLFVAETDFPLAPAITAALSDAVAIGDTGYTPPDPGLARAFVGAIVRAPQRSGDRRRVGVRQGSQFRGKIHSIGAPHAGVTIQVYQRSGEIMSLVCEGARTVRRRGVFPLPTST